MGKENNDENYVYEQKESIFEAFKKRLTQLRIGPPSGVKTTNRSMESLMNSGSITGFFRRLFDKAQNVLTSKPQKNLNTIQKVSVSDFEKNSNTLDKSIEPSKTSELRFPGLEHMKNVNTGAPVQVAENNIIDATTIVIAEAEIPSVNKENESLDDSLANDSSMESADISLDEEFEAELEEIAEIKKAKEAELQATNIAVNQRNNNIVNKNITKKQEKDGPEI